MFLHMMLLITQLTLLNHYWCAHTTRRELLEQSENKVKADERMPWPPAPKLPG